MDISALNAVAANSFDTQSVKGNTQQDSSNSFDDILATAMNMVSETNDYQNAAESAEIQFALGNATNTHDLQIAQEKANIALQYTVAVRDRAIDAYKEIMNMSI